MVVAVAAVGLCLEWLLLVSGFGHLDFVIRPVESVRHCFEGAFIDGKQAIFGWNI